MLHNALEVEGVYGSARITVTKIHSPMLLLALRGGGWVSNLREKALRNTLMALNIGPHFQHKFIDLQCLIIL